MHRRVSAHLFSHSSGAFVEMHNVVRGSRTWGRRNFAVAVTVSADASENKKSQRRVSKDQRRSLVESFVNNYRAMNAGNFPAAKTVQKEVGGSYYVIRDIVSELQYKSRMPSTRTRKGTTGDAKLHKNDDVSLEKIVAIKNSKLATKDKEGPISVLEEKTLSVEIDAMPAMTSEMTLSLGKHKLSNPQGGGPTSAMDETTRTFGAADEPTSAANYKSFSEEIAEPSVIDDNSAKTTNERYLVKEEAKDFYSTTSILEDNMREKTASKAEQLRQSSRLENVTSDLPEEHEKEPFRWNLKALANGFMKIWRKL